MAEVPVTAVSLIPYKLRFGEERWRYAKLCTYFSLYYKWTRLACFLRVDCRQEFRSCRWSLCPCFMCGPRSTSVLGLRILQSYVPLRAGRCESLPHMKYRTEGDISYLMLNLASAYNRSRGHLIKPQFVKIWYFLYLYLADHHITKSPTGKAITAWLNIPITAYLIWCQ